MASRNPEHGRPESDVTRVLSHLNVAAGISLFLTGFGIPDSSQAAWNVWILGATIFVLAVLRLTGERRAPPARPG